METQNILETVEAELQERLVSRRNAIKQGASISSMTAAGMGMASIPVALAALAKNVFAQGGLPQNIIDVLNFALTLEYLEAEFYVRGVQAPNLIPARDFLIFDQIRKHEVAHVHFLQSVLGSAAVQSPVFDYTAGNGSNHGPFTGVFSDYAIFTAVAQAFEDTGVRAYKGQAGNLFSNKAVLTAALQIHSVEARHAQEVRRLRGNFMEQSPNKGWITRNLTDIPGTQAVYAGEENTTHLGINVATISPMVGLDAATEAFDEPLTREQVLAIVDPFIV